MAGVPLVATENRFSQLKIFLKSRIFYFVIKEKKPMERQFTATSGGVGAVSQCLIHTVWENSALFPAFAFWWQKRLWKLNFCKPLFIFLPVTSQCLWDSMNFSSCCALLSQYSWLKSCRWLCQWCTVVGISTHCSSLGKECSVCVVPTA